jgi:tripartite-type tricarboxylate transporter receptor subunit TctC
VKTRSAAWFNGSIAALAALAVAAAPVHAQTYPDRSVRLIIPFAAGGAMDAVARILSQKLSENLGQQFIVDARPGAAGAIGAQAVAKAAPDGYTLLLGSNSTHAVLPALSSKLQYDMKEFAMIGMVGRAPNMLIASPKLEASSVAELIKLGHDRPGQLNFASSGTGAITHLISVMFNLQAGIKAVHVPYKTGVQSVPDLIDGQVQYLFDSIIWSLPMIRSGQLKGLGIATLQRSPLAPDIPTVSESGLPGFEGITWMAMFAPAGTPPDIITKLSREIVTALQSPDVIGRLAGIGVEASPGSPAELGELVARDIAKWKDVSQQTGLKLD